MTSKNIIMLTYALPPEHSGAALQALALAKSLSRMGHNVRFLSPISEFDPPTIKSGVCHGFRATRIYKGNLLSKVLTPVKIGWHLVKNYASYDVLHVHGVGYLAYIAVIVSIITKRKTVVKMTMLGEDDPLSIKGTRFGRVKIWLLKRISKLVSMNKAFMSSAYEAGVDESSSILLPNGVDTDRFKRIDGNMRRDIRQDLGVPCDSTVFVYAGIFRQEKGYDFLIDLFERLESLSSEYILLLVGPVESWFDENEREYVRENLNRIEALRSVKYLGATEDVHHVLGVSDYFISASVREGLPNVLLESMASGLVPIVNRLPGVHDEFTSGVDGMFVERRTVDAFVQTIDLIMSDKGRSAAIAKANLKRIEESHSIEGLARKYDAVYRNLRV